VNAGQHPAANYFGNTLRVMPLDKADWHYVFYNPDGSFEVAFPDSSRCRGTYTIEGEQVYLTALRPGDSKESTHCHYFDRARRAGDSWIENTSRGETHFRLDRGRP
jgi:hypothetical protein